MGGKHPEGNRVSRYQGMRYTVGIGTYAGIPVRIHATFPLILVLYAIIAGATGSWRDALDAAVLVLSVFGCVVLHEFGHCLMIKRYGIHVRDIVLFPIGGVARAESIPENGRHEILVAIAGPMVNFVIAGLLFGGLALARIPVHGDGYLVTLALANVSLEASCEPHPRFDGRRMRISAARSPPAQPYPGRHAARATWDRSWLPRLHQRLLFSTRTLHHARGGGDVRVRGAALYEERVVALRMRLSGRRGRSADTTRQVFAPRNASTRSSRTCTSAQRRPARLWRNRLACRRVVTADVLGAVQADSRRSRWRRLRATTFRWRASTEATRVYRHPCASSISRLPRWWMATASLVRSTLTENSAIFRARFRHRITVPSISPSSLASTLRCVFCSVIAIARIRADFVAHCCVPGRRDAHRPPLGASL